MLDYYRVIDGEKAIMLPAKDFADARLAAAKYWGFKNYPSFEVQHIRPPRDLPLFHICVPFLDSMGIYHHTRINKMSGHGWRFHDSGDPMFPSFAYRQLSDGRELRFESYRFLMKDARYIAVEVLDKHGRSQGLQYFAWSELTQYGE